MAIKKFEHVGVQVKDIKKSKEFYQNVIGLDLIDEVTVPGRSVHLAFLGLHNDIFIELIQLENSDFPAEGRVHHFALTVEGIEEERARLKTLGVPMHSGISMLPNGSKYMFFDGPDEEQIEFFEPAK